MAMRTVQMAVMRQLQNVQEVCVAVAAVLIYVLKILVVYTGLIVLLR
jgi:hypothetical protein